MLKSLSAQRCSRRRLRSLRPAPRPRVLLLDEVGKREGSALRFGRRVASRGRGSGRDPAGLAKIAQRRENLKKCRRDATEGAVDDRARATGAERCASDVTISSRRRRAPRTAFRARSRDRRGIPTACAARSSPGRPHRRRGRPRQSSSGTSGRRDDRGRVKRRGGRARRHTPSFGVGYEVRRRARKKGRARRSSARLDADFPPRVLLRVLAHIRKFKDTQTGSHTKSRHPPHVDSSSGRMI